MASNRAAALNHFVSFNVERKTSYADIVRRIAMGLCRVNPLPAMLEYAETAEHGVCFGAASNQFDLIAAQFGLEWGIRDGALTMTPESAQPTAQRKATGRPRAELSPFEALVGKLMLHATRKGSGHLAAGEFERIVAELDARNIKLDKALRKWNDSAERNGHALRSWQEAAMRRGARRIVQRLIYSAGEKYRSRAAYEMA
jgi:hypothetical protein